MKGKSVKIRKKKKSLVTRFLNLAIVCFLCSGIYILVSQQINVSKKKEEINNLQSKVEVAKQKNDEYQYLLSISDTDEYMRRIAIEKLGYAYPGEIRVYDTSKK